MMLKDDAELIGLSLPRYLRKRYDRPSYKALLGWLILVAILMVQFASIHKTQQDTFALIAEHRRLALVAAQLEIISSDTAYRNCLVNHALVEWSEKFAIHHPNADPDYLVYRKKIFTELHDTLVQADGIACVNPRVTASKLKALRDQIK